MKAARFLAILLFVTVISPVVSATPSGLTYTGSTWTSSPDKGSIISINSNQTLIAAAHDDHVALYDTGSLQLVSTFQFERVSALEFSPDGSLLAVNKGATFTVRESLVLIDVDDSTILPQDAIADDKAAEIAWNSDGTVIAAPGESGDIDLFRTVDMSLKSTLSGVHNSEITCIDYSADGKWIISGDESGRYAIWNTTTSQLVGDYIQYGLMITDCRFTPESSRYIVTNGDGKITVKNLDGLELDTTKLDGSKQILFSRNGQRVHIAYSDELERGLVTFDISGLNEATRTYMFHRIDDIDFIDDELSRITKIFVAGGTGGIAIYRSQLIPTGYGQPGKDTDMDMIPDIIDIDDDGDGLDDQWDNDIGCNAPAEIPCSEFPDLDKIRSVDFHFEEGILTISDHITLPPVPSSSIRNLSRLSQHDDRKLTSTEADVFADVMCMNMEHDEIIDQWRDSIIISSGALGTARVHCTMYGGMAMVQETDSITQITLTIVTTFLIESTIEYPLNLTLVSQPGPTDGSISWLAPSHPMAVSMHGEGGLMNSTEIWVNDGIPLELSMDEHIIPGKSKTEEFIYIFAHPIAVAFYLVFSMAGMLYWIRRDNKIELELEDDEEYLEINSESDDLEDDLEEEFSEVETVEDDKPRKRTPPKRTPPRSKRIEEPLTSELFGDARESEHKVERRKSNQGILNKDGPIMRTKKRRLGGDVATTEAPKISKKKVVKTNDGEIVKPRTRKVKSVKEPEVSSEPKKTKRRKPVKRKKKPGKTKKIDEDALQSGLIDEFTKSEIDD